METFAGMRLFAEVVDSGSFSAAGRRLGLAASSVARAIGTLENQLGRACSTGPPASSA
jgi:DNA-binding transcriptional LysR family regulator